MSFFQDNGNNGTWRIVSGVVKRPFRFTPTGAWHQVDIMVNNVSSTGSYQYDTGPPNISYVLTGQIKLKIVVYTLGAAPACPKTKQCEMTARIILGPTSAHLSPAVAPPLPVPGPNDVSTFVGSSTGTGGQATTAVGGACPQTIAGKMSGKTASADIAYSW